jgi:hypothetical protein
MHKFNLIALSLLFILSVAAAAPTPPELAIVERGSVNPSGQLGDKLSNTNPTTAYKRSSTNPAPGIKRSSVNNNNDARRR